SVPVQWRPTSTNGITYLNVISVIPGLTPDLKRYLPLFTQSLISLGTHERAMSKIGDKMSMNSVDIHIAPFLSTNHSSIDSAEEGFLFSSCCMDRSQDYMYYLFGSIIHETNFDDVSTLRTLIQRQTFELYEGMSQVHFMNALSQKEDLSEVSQRLKEIAELATKRSSL
ncbi:Mitochondrial presequence protease, partial [Dissophora globulifera]